MKSITTVAAAAALSIVTCGLFGCGSAQPPKELVDARTAYERSKDFVDDYLRVFARPDQLEAYQNRTKFIADVREEVPTAAGAA